MQIAGRSRAGIMSSRGIIRFRMARGSAVTDSLKGGEDRSQRMKSFRYCSRQ